MVKTERGGNGEDRERRQQQRKREEAMAKTERGGDSKDRERRQWQRQREEVMAKTEGQGMAKTEGQGMATTEGQGTACTSDVQGINNYQMVDIPIATVGGVINTQHSEVIAILHWYAYTGLGTSIHSPSQLEWYKNDVNDHSIKVG